MNIGSYEKNREQFRKIITTRTYRRYKRASKFLPKEATMKYNLVALKQRLHMGHIKLMI